jgi:hypothetical protein
LLCLQFFFADYFFFFGLSYYWKKRKKEKEKKKELQSSKGRAKAPPELPWTEKIKSRQHKVTQQAIPVSWQ